MALFIEHLYMSNSVKNLVHIVTFTSYNNLRADSFSILVLGIEEWKHREAEQSV